MYVSLEMQAQYADHCTPKPVNVCSSMKYFFIFVLRNGLLRNVEL